MRIRKTEILIILFLLWAVTVFQGSCFTPADDRPPTNAVDEGAADRAIGVLRPAALRCEYRIDPRGVDVAAPRLSWIVESEQRAQAQTAYRVLVAPSLRDLTLDEGTLWDSGKVLSDRTLHLVYDGKPLLSRQQCWWKARVWDTQGQPSEWSRPGHWTMGLLDRADWKAEWITLPQIAEKEKAASTLRRWIWHPESKGDGARVCFRCEVNLDPGEIKLSLTMTADDHYRLFVNGAECGSDDQWGTAETYALVQGEGIVPGRNVIAVEARNGAGPCGLLVGMEVNGPPGSGKSRIVDDGSWRCVDAETAGLDAESKDWTSIDYDDGSWESPATVGAYGDEPWGELDQGLLKARSAVELCRRFEVADGVVNRATIYVTAQGIYELALNGRKVGANVLAPEWTEYDRRIQYQTFDVTGMLSAGSTNFLTATVAEGWFAGRIGFSQPRLYGENPSLLMQLEIEFADGRRDVVATDASWRGTRAGAVRAAGIYDGETIDNRRAMTEWVGVAMGEKYWNPVTLSPLEEKVELVWQRCQPIGIVREIVPERLTEPRPGLFVFDLGQNMVGVCRLKARGPAGTAITLRHAERLNSDGTIYRDNLRQAAATDTFILDGRGEEVFEPRFTFHGFRYVEMTGAAGRPSLGDLVGLPMHTLAPETGRFQSSNTLVNQLMENILWGQRGNLTGIPTDCPQRDERLGWTGDILAFSEAAIFNMDLAAFFTKYVHDLRDAQHEDGRFPDFAPLGAKRDTGEFCGVPAWGDAGIVIPWRLYRYYGDERVLAEHFEAARRWIDSIHGQNPDLLWIEGRGNDYGDWVNGDSVRIEGFPQEGNAVPKEVFATAFFADSTRMVAEMARIVGRDAEARRYGTLAESIRAAFNEAYVDESGRIEGDTQAGYALALDMDLLDEPLRAGALKHLLAAIERYQGHLSTGFHTAYRLMRVLSEFGHHHEACRLINLRTPPSWGYMIEQGATTIWERWDGYVEGRGFATPGMNSFNHYMFGAVGEWIWSRIVGIDLDETACGFKRFTISPRPGPGFSWVSGAYDSIRGTIESEWRIEDGVFHLRVTVPANTTARVRIPTSDPAGVREGGMGLDDVEGLTPADAEPGALWVEAESGTYAFSAPFESAGK